MIAIAASFLKQVGLSPEQAVILVNDRKLTNAHLEKLGIPADKRPDFLSLIDRRQKMPSADWETVMPSTWVCPRPNWKG